MQSHRTNAKRAVRLGALITAGLLGATMFTACSATTTSTPKSTLTIVLHDNPATTTALKQMTAAFEKANPSITVSLSFIPSATYGPTRTSRLAAHQADIVEGAGGGGVAEQPNPSYTVGLANTDWVKGVENHQWVNLTNEPFVKDFQPSVIKGLAINGQTYEIPTALVDYSGVYYNKDIFKKVGVSVPHTWNAFVSVMQKIKAAGIIPLSAAGKDQWPVGLASLGLMQGQYPTTADLQALDKDLWTGKTTLDNPKLVKVMDQLKTMYGFMDPNFAGVDYATAEGQFTGGQAAMTVDGTWAVQQFATTNPSLNFGYFPIPASNTASDNSALSGKIDTLTFAIPSYSKNKAAAIKWLAFYSDPTNYAKFANVGGVLPVEPNIKLSPVVTKVLGNLTEQPFKLNWDQIVHNNPKAGAAATNSGLNYVGLAPLGTLQTGQAAQAAAQTAWAAGLKK